MPLTGLFKAKLIERKNLTEDVIEVTFELIEPAEISFKAGQFMNIRVKDEKPGMYMRPYSLLPSKEKNTVRFVIKIIPFGRTSEWINNAAMGTETDLFGPTGVFIFKEPKTEQIEFIGTGTGIAPLLAMIEEQAGQHPKKHFHLIWGFRYIKDIFYYKELSALSLKYPNFTFTITISRPEDDSWSGEIGRVTDFIQQKIDYPHNHEYYICGIGEMVKDVENLLAEKQTPAEQIHFERYN